MNPRAAVGQPPLARSCAARACRAVALCASLALAGSPAAQACGYHDPASASVGLLNWAYPDSLHVRTAVWMAQRDGVLARPEPLAAADPGSASSRFEQMLRYRDTEDRLDRLRDGLERSRQGRPLPAFSLVLIGPMLWTRLERADGTLQRQPHASGPSRGDVVIVTDGPVVAALVEGRLTPNEARERGMMRLYGDSEPVGQVWAVFDRLTAPEGRQALQVPVGP
jgi:hypothetical protein